MLQNSSKVDLAEINSDGQLACALERSKAEPIIIYKHSSICGLSSIAQREIEKFAAKSKTPVYRLVVPSARPISNAVETLFGIRHESPQAILVRDGHSVFDVSHCGVTATALETAIQGLSGQHG